MKKILLIANYFYPEVASTSQLLTEMCRGLENDFDITVVCAVPCYTGKIEKKYKEKKEYHEKLGNINIIRVNVPEFTKKKKLSRINHIIKYYFNAKKAIKRLPDQDIVITISQPPILGGLLGTYAKKRLNSKFVYLIEDFNPEQIEAVKYSKFKLLLKILRNIDINTCKNSNLVITVGRDMQELLKNRFKHKTIPKNVVINNWIDEKEIFPITKSDNNITKFKKKYDLLNKFVIMYSGNIGLYYDLENIIKVFGKYSDDDIVFTFIGEGAIKEKLQKYVKEMNIKNIKFIPYQDKKDLIYSLNSADVHLVTNAKGIKGVSVPSKIYGCMATNVPIFGILEEDSEAWKIIKDSKCGILAHTGNYKEIDNILSYIINNKKLFIKEHSTGRKYLEDNFTKEKSIEKYNKAFKQLTK